MMFLHSSQPTTASGYVSLVPINKPCCLLYTIKFPQNLSFKTYLIYGLSQRYTYMEPDISITYVFLCRHPFKVFCIRICSVFILVINEKTFCISCYKCLSYETMDKKISLFAILPYRNSRITLLVKFPFKEMTFFNKRTSINKYSPGECIYFPFRTYLIKSLISFNVCPFFFFVTFKLMNFMCR